MSLREAISWVKEAVTTKALVTGMDYYNFSDDQVRATNGDITASFPIDTEHEFLVPSDEFNKIIARSTAEIKLEYDGIFVKVKSGRLSATIETLQTDIWNYPGAEDCPWQTCPDNLLDVLRKLLPFVSEQGTYAWSVGICLRGGWAFATNSISLAGVQYEGAEEIDVIVPIWAIKFLLATNENPIHWCWNQNYVAFEWESGAWMRSNLIAERFPDKIAQLIEQASSADMTAEVTKDFKDAFNRVCFKDEEVVTITNEKIIVKYGKSLLEEEIETPCLGLETHWSVKILKNVIESAEWWSPDMFPSPVPFQGNGVCGMVLGRKDHVR